MLIQPRIHAGCTHSVCARQALSYAKSRCPLVFKYKTQGLNRGCSIQYLSLYPKETEYLYPPLTFIFAEGECYTEDGTVFLDVTPQMS
jgi:hypothetical protein